MIHQFKEPTWVSRAPAEPVVEPDISVEQASQIRKRLDQRLKRMAAERTNWESHWADIADHILPRRQRIRKGEREKAGSRRNDKIHNNTATRALRILGSGMMAGITSPSRQWFKLVAPRPDLMDDVEVLLWLAEVEGLMAEVFQRSNVYNVLAQAYEDLAAFGTSCLYIEPDVKNVVRVSVYEIGSYYLAEDRFGRVSAVYHETSMTVEQLVDKFGKDNVSLNVLKAFNEGNYDQHIDIVHAVERNPHYMPGKLGWRGKRWWSVWFEAGSGSDRNQPLLGLAGYSEFPYACPRWSKATGEVYGGSPGMDALGDIRMLQKMEARRLQVLEKVVNPTMKGPVAMRAQGASLLPGAVNFVNELQGRGKFEPAHAVDPRALGLGGEMERVENRINGAFLADLFLMIANTAVTGVTAREIDEKHEEKMLQLGPVLERIQDELLRQLIDAIFEIMQERGMIPEPPPAIQELAQEDFEIGVEYVSIFAQAQRLPSANAIERHVLFLQNIASFAPDAVDTLDTDEAARRYNRVVGGPPEIVRSRRETEAIRKQRQQAAAAAAAKDGTQALKQGADAMKAVNDAGGLPPGAERTASEALGPGLLGSGEGGFF